MDLEHRRIMQKRIKQIGQAGMALTNHGNVDGNIKFQNEFIKQGLIPIHGCEFYIVENIKEHTKGEKKKSFTCSC